MQQDPRLVPVGRSQGLQQVSGLLEAHEMKEDQTLRALFNLWGAAVCLLVLLLISGCAQNMLRVTEYKGSALPIPGVNAAAGGCVIQGRGEITGRLVYEGENCQFDSEDGL